MSYYALTDVDWPFDDEQEGRAIIVEAATPNEAVAKATSILLKEQSQGAGGVTWKVASLSDIGFQDASWGDDVNPSFGNFAHWSDGSKGPSFFYEIGRLKEALQNIVALRGYTGSDMGRVAGYRVAAEIAEKALNAEADQTDTKQQDLASNVVAPADYEVKLVNFLEAMDEWGCEDNTERAQQILEFQRTGYDLDDYLLDHPTRDKSELN